MPTGRGLAVLALGAVLVLSGWALGVEEFVLVALSAATLLLWAAAAVHLQARRARRALSARVEEPRREVSVGDEATVVVRVRSTTRRRSLSWLALEEPEPWTVSYPGLLGIKTARTRVRGDSPARLLPVGTKGGLRARRAPWWHLGALRGGDECALGLTVPTIRRGLWSQPGVRVWCTDPLGLAASPVGRLPATDVVVVPRPASRPAGATGAGAGAGNAAGRRAGGTDAEGWVAPGGDEFAGLRPYVAGDRLTRFHWPALARSGDLLVRDFVEPLKEMAELVVDDRPEHVEESVAQAADRGTTLLDGGTGLVVRTVGGERLDVPPGPAASCILLRSLALIGARR